jgi:hypothetical protein
MSDIPLTLDMQSIGATTVAVYPTTAPVLASEADSLDVIGALYGTGAELVVFAVEQLAPTFFDLRTGLAGAILQKFQNYGLRVAILGDVSAHIAASQALADFVRETTRRGEVLFLADAEELERRLR